MRLKIQIIITVCLCIVAQANAQIVKEIRNDIQRGNFNPGYGHDGGTSSWNEISSDSTGRDLEAVPESIYVWKLDAKFGDLKSALLDTLHHGFQRQSFTSGQNGRYNYTGNLGSPRHSRIFSDNQLGAFGSQFVFQQPYDNFVKPTSDHLFTNTRSPFTNITYHECGDKEHGEDRISAMFATNAGKKLGLGFVVDYLYGRGYFQSQNTAHFKGAVYSSYISETYRAHLLYQLHYLKTSENGGIEDDLYITEPESFSTTYETWDMPTNLKKTWNKLNINELLFSQRLKFGLRNKKNRSEGADSLKLLMDSTSLDTSSIQPSVKDLPFTIIHTLNLAHNDRLFMSNFRANEQMPTYFNDYYLPGDSANDMTKNLSVKNTLALELNEGWADWCKAGARVFISHDYQHFTLPQTRYTNRSFNYNYLHVGAQLLNQKSRYFDFNLLGELRTCDGKEWGEFNIKADGKLRTRMLGDSLVIAFYGQFLNEAPSFYHKHYQGRNAWWDNEGLDNQTFVRFGSNVKFKNWNLILNLEQVNNLVYFQESVDKSKVSDKAPNAYLHSVASQQNGKPIQRLEVTLKNHFNYGVLNWDNELSYQASSQQTTLPLPKLNVYSNLYFKFKIAKVLNTELGVDAIYFTKYAPQVYSPIIGNYVVQDPSASEKVGDYPIVNAYANFHLKRTRFYIMASHINASEKNKKAFHLPHMPMNPMLIRLGISWNFVN